MSGKFSKSVKAVRWILAVCVNGFAEQVDF